MHKLQRHQLILEQVARHGFVTLELLRDITQASLPTLRRDVNHLAELGELKRCHGGVQETESTEPKRLRGVALDYSSTARLHQKQAIARAAASLCTDGESIILHGGTTVFQIVRNIETLQLDVLTNSLPIANYLFEQSVARLHIPGGEVYRDQHLILSPFEDDTIKNFHAAKMFVGAQAVCQQGVLEVDPRLIQSELKLMAQAQQLILCVDSSKFDKSGSMILAPIDRFDLVITDEGISASARRWLDRSGIEVCIVAFGDVAAA